MECRSSYSIYFPKKVQTNCKPGSVSEVVAPPMSVIYLLHESPHGSSVLPCSSGEQPSSATIHELAASKVYSQSCRHAAGGLLPRLLTLTHPPAAVRQTVRHAVVFFYTAQPSRAASIFGSGMLCAARTFLSHVRMEQPATDRPSALFQVAKVRFFLHLCKLCVA